MYNSDNESTESETTLVCEPTKAEKTPENDEAQKEEQQHFRKHTLDIVRDPTTVVKRRSAKIANELKLQLTFRNLGSREIFAISALLDSGAMDTFIDKGLIDKYQLEVQTLDVPIPVYNADGLRNRLGDITRYIDLEMTFGDHKEVMRLYATSLGQERIFIRHDWL
jgi:hypothetical protein